MGEGKMTVSDDGVSFVDAEYSDLRVRYDLNIFVALKPGADVFPLRAAHLF